MDSDAIPTLESDEYAELLQRAREHPEVGQWMSGVLTAASLALFSVGAGLIAVLPWSPWLVVPLCGLVLSVSMLMLSLVVHECAHRTLFQRRWPNDLFGIVAGILTATPFFSYRRGHKAHHRYLGSSAGKDPTASPQREFKENRLLDALLSTGLLPVFYWGGVYGPYAFYELFPTAGDRRPLRLLLWTANVALIVAVHIGVAWLFGWIYLAAFAVGFIGSGMLYENLFTLNQHIGLLAVPEGKERYSFREQLNFSRSVHLPLAALIFYFNLHKEHHLAPGLNWRYLPVLHRLLRSRHPEIYEFTDEELAIARRRRMRAHELLTPEIGD